ncbi:hypothetical protein BU15DRAFT_44636 [Melanogaster broomeanus]|nr:hypothetical protein BU15DRAFT_44636 [Melanogaster broomeanus]
MVNKTLLKSKGRILGRWVDMWLPFRTIFEDGMELATGKGQRQYTPVEGNIVDIYETVLRIAPQTLDEINKAGSAGIPVVSKVLEDTRRHTRGDDISSMKERIGHWRALPGIRPADFAVSRHTLGFNNRSTGNLLCPANRDYSQAKQVLDFHGLCDGTIKAGACDFPHLLWDQEMVNPEDFFDGWLRNELLVQAYKHIFISPSAALVEGGPEKPARRGNAALHGICTVSIPSISYVATLVRFVLSSDSSISRGGPGRFGYEAFYNNIISTTFDMLDSAATANLINWWNR